MLCSSLFPLLYSFSVHLHLLSFHLSVSDQCLCYGNGEENIQHEVIDNLVEKTNTLNQQNKRHIAFMINLRLDKNDSADATHVAQAINMGW
ncbi:hypothetical protein B0T24DRAFT_22943 [Lasiosphaeria ovina]|uniref:Secreted protein n=1 Tax=Lasiosphaeria ovina TaxID=92902 RepID=A0AAE0TX47_9PEZI|nr:hypothetical protein B0T24DRAFT_22943 [Lasiosphaeria ovina]